MQRILDLAVERRRKVRFPMVREMQYKVLDDETIVESGMGTTFDMGSGGVGFQTDHPLTPGSFIQLSISWPVLLEGTCPIRLIVFGRVVRSSLRKSACTVDKYEFRTQSRAARPVATIRSDTMLQRWADTIRKESLKAASM
jgi:hypothetical protein